jgi:transcriptional regulator with XRE-family HTH domain
MAERKTKPPVRAMTTGKAPESATICDQLRQAIQDSGKTHYRIGKDAGVKPEMVSRFARGERDVRAETFAKICIALGLRLTGSGLDKKE